MNIFALSDEEFEKYLKEDLDNKNPKELLLELIECGLECSSEMRHFTKEENEYFWNKVKRKSKNIGVDNNEEDDYFLI